MAGLLRTVAEGSYIPTSAITTVLREQLYEDVTTIDPVATVALDMFASAGTIESPVYQWNVDSLPGLVLNNTAGSIDVDGINVQGILEGFDNPNFATNYPYTGQPQRLTNFIQMFAAKVGVSDTLKKAKPSGIRDPYNWEALKATRVIKKAIERRFFDNASANASSVTGSGGDPRRMYRLFDFATTAVVPAAYVLPQVTANSVLTPALIDQLMETVVGGASGDAGGGEPTALVMSIGSKFDISAQLRANSNSPASGALSPMNWQTISAQERRVIRNINVYEGDAGELMLAWTRQIPQSNATTGGGKVWAIQPDMIQYGFYSAVEHIPLAKTGYNTKGIIVGEVGYRFLNPKSCGVINNVTT